MLKEKCRQCGGSKKVRGMGMMMTTCKACDSSGFTYKAIVTEQEQKKPEKTQENAKVEEKKVKKGFQKKDVTSDS